MSRHLVARHESWALSRPFRISRGVKEAADVVVVEAHGAGCVGVGEAVPYARYGERVDSVLRQIEDATTWFEQGMTRQALQRLLPPGAARNAVDCALWDLEAKQRGVSVAGLAGRARPTQLVTAVTISLSDAAQMARAAADVRAPLLKIKVGADDPLTRVAAVRAAAPNARLIVDPNESWDLDLLRQVLPALADLDVALIEQPVPSSSDAGLEGMSPVVPICADEAAHTSADLDRIATRYQVVNIKLDKAGGLTEALLMRARADELGLGVMIGCMVCTSLGIAPALLLTDGAAFVDLDGPWWMARDRDNAVQIENGVLTPPAGGWGVPG